MGIKMFLFLLLVVCVMGLGDIGDKCKTDADCIKCNSRTEMKLISCLYVVDKQQNQCDEEHATSGSCRCYFKINSICV